MSKLSDQFSLGLPLEDASWACKEAVTNIGWNVGSLEENRIVPKVGVGISRNPSKVEILLEPEGGSSARIVLNGQITGFGPIQKRHLMGEINRLRNAIEVEANSSKDD